ncbi:hypothetical protein [Archangium lansingense]|uniref:Uncharacterized protein n=1 Tax=Archangium lansingense TaxID=2995310 RepID=A0ABT4ABG0_9BACT|nr:hypothetical protein [Archangium lansinium]MCY1079018.1 hypothetical protein [Archangium lansinium]
MRDEKQRQKTRARKQKKREQKRRMLASRKPGWLDLEGLGPDAKLSMTLLAFASPILSSLPKAQFVPDVVQGILECAADVWNVVVGSEPGQVAQRLVELARYHAQLQSIPEVQMADLVIGLAERKVQDFPSDYRAVFSVQVRWRDTGDELRVYAAGAVLSPGTWIPAPLSMTPPPSHEGDDPDCFTGSELEGR